MIIFPIFNVYDVNLKLKYFKNEDKTITLSECSSFGFPSYSGRLKISEFCTTSEEEQGDCPDIMVDGDLGESLLPW